MYWLNKIVWWVMNPYCLGFVGLVAGGWWLEEKLAVGDWRVGADVDVCLLHECDFLLAAE